MMAQLVWVAVIMLLLLVIVITVIKVKKTKQSLTTLEQQVAKTVDYNRDLVERNEMLQDELRLVKSIYRNKLLKNHTRDVA